MTGSMTGKALVAALLASLVAGFGAAPALAQRAPESFELQERGRDRQDLRRGDPSTVVAAELAFARMAREEGTWTAFRKYATEDALWPSPALTSVQQDLADTPDPADPIVWGPDSVWVSCDGSFALSTGPASYATGRRTRFATIWQRQSKGDYRWVLDQGFDLEAGYEEPEMIGAKVAECPAGFSPRRSERADVRRGEAWGSGRSDDGTFEWTTEIAADCSRTLTVRIEQDGTMTEVFRRVSSPPAAREGQPAPSCGS